MTQGKRRVSGGSLVVRLLSQLYKKSLKTVFWRPFTGELGKDMVSSSGAFIGLF